MSLQPYSDVGLLHFLWDMLVTVVLRTGQWVTVVLMICIDKNCFCLHYMSVVYNAIIAAWLFALYPPLYHTSLTMNVHLSPMFVHDSLIDQIIFRAPHS